MMPRLTGLATIAALLLLAGCTIPLTPDTQPTPPVGVEAPKAASTPKTGPWTPPLRTKVSGCVARGALPDVLCTPGSVLTTDVKRVCVPGYSGTVRNVPTSEKAAAAAEYGLSYPPARGTREFDHLVSLELGGSNDLANLWPEAANPRPGFHDKDVLENTLHAAVCAGRLSLPEAQRLIATDWLAAYRQYAPGKG